MSFENVNKKVNFKKLTGLNEGDQLIGYVTGFSDSTIVEGQKNIQMVIDGESALVAPAGNVKYLITDGKLQVGLKTRITRIADKMIKGKKATQYTVEQDASDSVSSATEAQLMSSSASSAPSSATASKASKIESLKALKA